MKTALDLWERACPANQGEALAIHCPLFAGQHGQNRYPDVAHEEAQPLTARSTA